MTRAHHRRAARQIAQAVDVVVAQLLDRAMSLLAGVAELLVEDDGQVLDEATLNAIAGPSTSSAARRAA